MEVAYTVTFRPRSGGDAAANLIVATERERFAVPLVGAGAVAALDLPDAISIRDAPPVRAAAQQPLLVCNVGGAAGSFSLAASGPFSVTPHRGMLAPGESLQLVVTFVPPGPGGWEGELEVTYDGSGRATYTRLSGRGRELDVGLSADELRFLPTHMERLSQKSVWVVNNGDRPAAFAFKAAAADAQGTGTGALARRASASPPRGPPGRASSPSPRDSDTWRDSGDGPGDAAGTGADGGQPAVLEAPPTARSDASCGTASSAGDTLLADPGLAASRAAKRAARAAACESGLFASPFFAAFPPTGVVPPGGRAEVIVQFGPDAAGDFEAAAFVELDGRAEHARLALRGRGLGPVLAFPYEALDVGDAFINTPHAYEVELMNRGKVDAEFRLQPSHTRWVGLGQSCGRLPGRHGKRDW
jgi:hydrocephalus-inducing protein